MNLSSYLEKIKSHKPLQTNLVVYKRQRWDKHFDEKHYLDDIGAFDGQNISRQTIIDYYSKYYEGKVQHALLPFLLTMIWGYDSSGFGPFRVNRFMTNMNREIIHDALVAVERNEIEQAFQLLMRIKGLNISFVSKILYFGGRAAGIKEYPLIFDIQVARKLVSIASGGFLDNIVDIFPGKKYANYKSYNDVLHKWAQDLGVEAEEVEYFIFRHELSGRINRKNRYGPRQGRCDDQTLCGA